MKTSLFRGQAPRIFAILQDCPQCGQSYTSSVPMELDALTLCPAHAGALLAGEHLLPTENLEASAAFEAALNIITTEVEKDLS